MFSGFFNRKEVREDGLCGWIAIGRTGQTMTYIRQPNHPKIDIPNVSIASIILVESNCQIAVRVPSRDGISFRYRELWNVGLSLKGESPTQDQGCRLIIDSPFKIKPANDFSIEECFSPHAIPFVLDENGFRHYEIVLTRTGKITITHS